MIEASTTRKPAMPCTRRRGVHYGERVVAHFAGAHRMVESLDFVAQKFGEVGIAGRVRAGMNFLRRDSESKARVLAMRRARRTPAIMVRRS